MALLAQMFLVGNQQSFRLLVVVSRMTAETDEAGLAVIFAEMGVVTGAADAGNRLLPCPCESTDLVRVACFHVCGSRPVASLAALLRYFLSFQCLRVCRLSKRLVLIFVAALADFGTHEPGGIGAASRLRRALRDGHEADKCTKTCKQDGGAQSVANSIHGSLDALAHSYRGGPRWA